MENIIWQMRNEISASMTFSSRADAVLEGK